MEFSFHRFIPLSQSSPLEHHFYDKLSNFENQIEFDSLKLFYSIAASGMMNLDAFTLIHRLEMPLSKAFCAPWQLKRQ